MVANCKFREHLLSFYLLLGAVGNNRPQSSGRTDIKAYVRAIIEPKRTIEKTESLLKQKLNYTLLFVAGQPVPPERQRLKDTRETH